MVELEHLRVFQMVILVKILRESFPVVMWGHSPVEAGYYHFLVKNYILGLTG